MKLSGTEKKFFGVEKLVFLKKKFGKISENFVFDFFSIILLSVDSNIFFENPAGSLFRNHIRLYLHAKFKKNPTCGYREMLKTVKITL